MLDILPVEDRHAGSIAFLPRTAALARAIIVRALLQKGRGRIRRFVQIMILTMTKMRCKMMTRMMVKNMR